MHVPDPGLGVYDQHSAMPRSFPDIASVGINNGTGMQVPSAWPGQNVQGGSNYFNWQTNGVITHAALVNLMNYQSGDMAQFLPIFSARPDLAKLTRSNPNIPTGMSEVCFCLPMMNYMLANDDVFRRIYSPSLRATTFTSTFRYDGFLETNPSIWEGHHAMPTTQSVTKIVYGQVKAPNIWQSVVGGIPDKLDPDTGSIREGAYLWTLLVRVRYKKSEADNAIQWVRETLTTRKRKAVEQDGRTALEVAIKKERAFNAMQSSRFRIVQEKETTLEVFNRLKKNGARDSALKVTPGFKMDKLDPATAFRIGSINTIVEPVDTSKPLTADGTFEKLPAPNPVDTYAWQLVPYVSYTSGAPPVNLYTGDPMGDPHNHFTGCYFYNGFVVHTLSGDNGRCTPLKTKIAREMTFPKARNTEYLAHINDLQFVEIMVNAGTDKPM